MCRCVVTTKSGTLWSSYIVIIESALYMRRMNLEFFRPRKRLTITGGSSGDRRLLHCLLRPLVICCLIPTSIASILSETCFKPAETCLRPGLLLWACRRRVRDMSLTCQRHVCDKFSAQDLSETWPHIYRQVSDKIDAMVFELYYITHIGLFVIGALCCVTWRPWHIKENCSKFLL